MRGAVCSTEEAGTITWATLPSKEAIESGVLAVHAAATGMGRWETALRASVTIATAGTVAGQKSGLIHHAYDVMAMDECQQKEADTQMFAFGAV